MKLFVFFYYVGIISRGYGFFHQIGSILPFQLKQQQLQQQTSNYYQRWIFMTTTESPTTIGTKKLDVSSILSTSNSDNNNDNNNSNNVNSDSNIYDGTGWETDEWEGYQDGFDWQLERARRLLEGPGFAPIRMTLWQPGQFIPSDPPPGLFDSVKILLNNALSMMGFVKSLDGAPVVQGVNTFKGDPLQLFSRLIDGDLAELAGGPLFLLLNSYYKQYGPVYKLAFGPKSFMVISDPVMAKHILKENPHKYDKGILAEILYPIMGKGLIPADPETWKVRRRAIVPGFHKAWLNAMMKLFVSCNDPLVAKLEAAADTNQQLNMETEFCSVSLDIIGKAVFNYNFGSVNQESPIVKAVYRTLQEAEHRSTSFIPYWNLPFAKYYIKNLRDFEENMKLLNQVLDELILKAVDTKNEADVQELEKRDYSKMENPSLLRFLVDMRGEDTTSRQLRDDLMTMLIAGHETTAAVLTWTFFNLAQQPLLMERVRKEIDEVLQGREPLYEDMTKLTLVRLCLAETLRLYPEPPLLIRRAIEDDILPKGGAEKETFIPRGADIFIATWNIHRSDQFWDKPEQYNPDRFLTSFKNPNQPQWAGQKPSNTNSQLYPNEVISDFAFLPFGGGTRKCVGDQFAMMEAVATMVMVLQRFDLSLAIKPEDVGMKTGATIHTANGLMMNAKRRMSQSHTNQHMTNNIAFDHISNSNSNSNQQQQQQQYQQQQHHQQQDVHATVSSYRVHSTENNHDSNIITRIRGSSTNTMRINPSDEESSSNNHTTSKCPFH